MSTRFSNAVAEAEAEAALQKSQGYQATKGEELFNMPGDKVAAVSNSEAVAIMQSTAASEAFDMIKIRVNHFVENTKILVGVLDEVGRVCPWIQFAVSVFKTAIELEVTRRENDQKVIVLYEKMRDMMEVMTLLRDITKHQVKDEMSLKQRLQGRMDGIVDSIKRCSEICESYQNRHAIVKFATRSKWEITFANMAAEFGMRKNGLAFDMFMYTGKTASNVGVTPIPIKESVMAAMAMMEMVFAKMLSPEEKELEEFAQRNHGIEEVLKNLKLKEQLLIEHTCGARDEKRPSDIPTTVAELEQELAKGVKTVLKENRKAFGERFMEFNSFLKKDKGPIQRESDRDIQEVSAGTPDEQIIDKDLYYIWKEMGWRLSADATHLGIALHDHFVWRVQYSPRKAMIPGESQPSRQAETSNHEETITANPLPEIPVKDRWSLQYIAMNRLRPLVEALDDDGSSSVTVDQVNEFTSSRPKEWSLVRWIAYWTAGFEMTTNWYWRRIRKNLNKVVCACGATLPANRAAVHEYLQRWIFQPIDEVLAGLQGTSEWDSIRDWDEHSLFSEFKDYILDEERRLKTTLRRLSYNIDQDNTLYLLTRGGRPEKYALPLLCLLLERVVWTMDAAKNSLVSPKEFLLLGASIKTVVDSMHIWADKLQATYQRRNEHKDALENVFFGIYSYISRPHVKNDNWTQPLEEYDWFPDVDLGYLGVLEPPLFHQVESEVLEHFLDETSSTERDVASPEITSPVSLVGAWSGKYTITNSQTHILITIWIIEQNTNGAFKGHAIHAGSAWSVTGTLHGTKIDFTISSFNHSTGPGVRLSGILFKNHQAIFGRWTQILDPATEALVSRWDHSQVITEAAPSSVIVEDPTSNQEKTEIRDNRDESPGDYGVSEAAASDTSEKFGVFGLLRRPLGYAPPDTEFQETEPKRPWGVVRKQIISRTVTWDTLRDRRDQRNRFTQLYLTQKRYGGFYNPLDSTEWARIICQTPPNDLHLWRGIAQFKQRRMIKLSDFRCDSCGKDIDGSRLLCSDCTEGGWSISVDLCMACQSSQCSRKEDNKNHSPAHTLLQLRQPFPNIGLSSLFQRARSVVQDSRNRFVGPSRPKCTVCHKPIVKMVYWCCMACDTTHVCTSCNLQIEAEEWWLLQRAPEPKGSHGVLHTLVLVTNLLGSSQAESTVEEGGNQVQEQAKTIRDLRAQLAEHETVMSDRLQRVENLLERLLTRTSPD